MILFSRPGAVLGFALISVFVFAQLAGTVARANQFGFANHALVMYFETQYFQTNRNFDPNGNSDPLPNSNSVTELRFDISAAYDFSNRFEIYGEGNFNQEQAVINNGPGLGGVIKNNGEPGDLKLGVNYLLLQKFVSITPDVSVSAPLYPAPGTDTNPLIGDGAVTGSFKVYITKQMKSFLISGYAGYTYRNLGYSALIPYGLLAHLEMGPIYIQGGVAGAASQNNDQYTANPLPRFNIDTTNDGGSLLYNSVNPSWLNVLGSVGIRLSRQFFVTGGVEALVAGQDVAQGTRFLVGLGYSTVPTRTAQKPTVDTQEREEFKTEDHGDNGAGFDVDTSNEDATIPGEKVDNPNDSKSYPNQKIFAPTR